MVFYPSLPFLSLYVFFFIADHMFKELIKFMKYDGLVADDSPLQPTPENDATEIENVEMEVTEVYSNSNIKISFQKLSMDNFKVLKNAKTYSGGNQNRGKIGFQNIVFNTLRAYYCK